VPQPCPARHAPAIQWSPSPTPPARKHRNIEQAVLHLLVEDLTGIDVNSTISRDRCAPPRSNSGGTQVNAEMLGTPSRTRPVSASRVPTRCWISAAIAIICAAYRQQLVALRRRPDFAFGPVKQRYAKQLFHLAACAPRSRLRGLQMARGAWKLPRRAIQYSASNWRKFMRNNLALMEPLRRFDQRTIGAKRSDQLQPSGSPAPSARSER